MRSYTPSEMTQFLAPAERQAARQDEGVVKALLAECELPSQDLTPDHLDQFLLLKMNGELVGCVGLEIYDHDALLRSLAIPRQQRGGGIGVYWVGEAETYARSRGVDTIYLLTTTAESFFIHLGYRKIDRDYAPGAIRSSTEFQSACPTSAVCLTKGLGQTQ